MIPLKLNANYKKRKKKTLKISTKKILFDQVSIMGELLVLSISFNFRNHICVSLSACQAATQHIL